MPRTPVLHEALGVLVGGIIPPLIVADSSSVIIAINDAARGLLGKLGDEAVGLKVAHLLRPLGNTSADLTDPGLHRCSLVEGDDKLACITKCAGGYTCLNLTPVHGAGDQRSDWHGAEVAGQNEGGDSVGVREPYLVAPSAAEAEMVEHEIGDEPLLGASNDELDVGLHVLFCDDDPFQASVMRMLCAANGYTISHFSNGPDAIAALRECDSMAVPYNLVLLDLNMQPMHGLEVLKHIRSFHKSITVIIITATEDDAMVKACIVEGANSYIVKPVRDKDVRNLGHFALEASKAEKLRRRTRVRNAIASVLTTRFAIVFMPLRALEAQGRLISHEEARSKGLLVQCDTYEDVAEFIRTHPTAFFSHQWLSRSHPDPEGLQFELMIDASRRLCEMEGVSEDALFVWVDFSSIPQKNKYMQRLSISTLGVYASLCKFFVVVAPHALQHDSNLRCDSATYRRRGWCRLEQWAHLTAAGTSNMYVIERPGELQAISNQEEWVDDSIRVFGGDFTWEEDKQQLVDVVLGLWSLTLVASAAGLAHVAPIVAKVDAYKAEVFPSEYFADLVRMLEREIAAHYGARAEAQQVEATMPYAQPMLQPHSPTRKQRLPTFTSAQITLGRAVPASELHVMAAELVEFRRLFHRVVRTMDRGATALEQVTQSMMMLAMPLDREGARDAIVQLNKEPRGPPLSFRDYCRVLSKLRKGAQQSTANGRAQLMRLSNEQRLSRASQPSMTGIDAAMQAMAVRDGRELVPVVGSGGDNRNPFGKSPAHDFGTTT